MPRAVLLLATLVAQSTVAPDLREAIWDAVQSALPFPAANERHEPVDGNTSARWLVRRAGADDGGLVAEVIANPLNRDTQTRAARDMAAIQQEVFAAEQRAQVEFERAREAARRSGAPVPVEGITLDDEGVAGDRADAEERMTIEVEIGAAEHVMRIDAIDPPTVTALSGSTWLVKVSARELPGDGDARAHYYPAQAIVYVASAKPTFSESARRVFTVRTTGKDVISVTLRGNSDLIDQVVAQAHWSRVAR